MGEAVAQANAVDSVVAEEDEVDSEVAAVAEAVVVADGRGMLYVSACFVRLFVRLYVRLSFDSR